mgnify:CR=1 FL=1
MPKPMARRNSPSFGKFARLTQNRAPEMPSAFSPNLWWFSLKCDDMASRFGPVKRQRPHTGLAKCCKTCRRCLSAIELFSEDPVEQFTTRHRYVDLPFLVSATNHLWNHALCSTSGSTCLSLIAHLVNTLGSTISAYLVIPLAIT